uniref:Uncharacterized protein n=1 Tax=Coptotermes formosanus TaxID=36987 RepID=R4V371_COPFO|nr:hypothetical protein [Coptotermes formosanus]
MGCFITLIRLLTIIVLALVATGYLLEFSYRNKTLQEKFTRNDRLTEDAKYKYKGLRTGKPYNGVWYLGCYKWRARTFMDQMNDDDYDYYVEHYYDTWNEKSFYPYDPVTEPDSLTTLPILYRYKPGTYTYSVKPEHYWCTNEWFKWQVSRLFPAVLVIYMAVCELCNLFNCTSCRKFLIFGILSTAVLEIGLGIDVLGVAGDLGFSFGIFLIVLGIIRLILGLMSKLNNDD